MTTTGAAPARPNILWISLEDTSPRFGCYGDPLARTPNIDRLAEQGVRYTRAFAVAGVCAPSRSAVITGMYPTSIGTHHMRTSHDNPLTPELPTPYAAVPPPYVKVFTEYLRAEGYYCTNNWKTDYQFPSPLTAWDEDGHQAHWRHREAGQPFFAVFNHYATHESSMWGGDAGDGGGAGIVGGSGGVEQREESLDPNGADIPQDSSERRRTTANRELLHIPPYLPDTPKSRRALARYYDLIADADDYVGGLLRELAEDGLADNTIVFLWSDHGEGLPRAKRWPYDAGIRVPLIVRWPGAVTPGQVDDRLVSLIDLAPTVLAAAGAAVPTHLEGQPFLGERAAAAEPRSYVYATRDRYDDAYDMMRAVRDKQFKYIRNYYPNEPYLQWIPYSHRHPMLQELWRLRLSGRLDGHLELLMQDSRPAEELYDCERDPYEMHNLAGAEALQGELLRLRQALDDWRQRYDRWGDVPEERMVAQMWPGGKQPQTAAPLMIPINGELPGVAPAAEGCFEEPTAIMLYAATQGASIAYTTETGEAARWRLYTGPLVLAEGATVIRAIAVRIGYRDSEEAVGTFEVRERD